MTAPNVVVVYHGPRNYPTETRLPHGWPAPCVGEHVDLSSAEVDADPIIVTRVLHVLRHNTIVVRCE